LQTEERFRSPSLIDLAISAAASSVTAANFCTARIFTPLKQARGGLSSRKLLPVNIPLVRQ